MSVRRYWQRISAETVRFLAIELALGSVFGYVFWDVIPTARDPWAGASRRPASGSLEFFFDADPQRAALAMFIVLLLVGGWVVRRGWASSSYVGVLQASIMTYISLRLVIPLWEYSFKPLTQVR